MFDKLHMEFVREHYTTFRKLHLEGCAEFHTATLIELADAYNGIGPDRLPWIIRQAITLGSRIFAPSALEHDLAYVTIIKRFAEEIVYTIPEDTHELYLANLRSRPDETCDERHRRLWTEFDESNARFYRNCCTIARDKFPKLYDPRRYMWLVVAKFYHWCLYNFGITGIIDNIEAELRIKSEARAIVSEVFRG